MRNHSLLLLTSALFGCLGALQPAVVQAEPIPTLSITSATGEATWSVLSATSTANLSGPDFSLHFTGSFPPPYNLAFPGEAFSPVLPIHEIVGAPEFATGSLTVAGVTGVLVASLDATASASTIVPSGPATVVLPAALTGAGVACIASEFFPGCMGTPTINPVFIANVNFDIPGLLTVDFTPAGIMGGVETERFAATFTPVPEPGTVALVLGALAVTIGWKLLHIGRPAILRSSRGADL